MANNDRIGRLARQLGERLQDASHAPGEIQRGMHNVMRGAFNRMELVSREDFDILMDVLQRTRARVESLEKQVAALEATLDDVAASPEDSGEKKPASDASADNRPAANTSADKKTRRAKPAGPRTH